MATVDFEAAQEVLKKLGVKTDVSGKWVSSLDVAELVKAVALKCAEVADSTTYCPGHAIKKSFGLE